MNILGLLLQLFVVSRVVKYLGVPIGVMILPCISLTAYGIISFFPLLRAVLAAKVAENSTDYSLNNTVRNMLFLPCTREQKYSAKQAIDSFFVRMGDVLSAAIVFVGTNVLHHGGPRLRPDQHEYGPHLAGVGVSHRTAVQGADRVRKTAGHDGLTGLTGRYPRPAVRDPDSRTAVSGSRSLSEIFIEEVDRPLPRQLGRGLVVARRRVVVEPVLRARVDERSRTCTLVALSAAS